MRRQWRKPTASDHYQNGKFHNLIPTQTVPSNGAFGRILRERLMRPNTVYPPVALPSVKTDLQVFDSSAPAVIWFGHSSYLIICNGVRILVDPVFSGYASPFPWMLKAFKGADAYLPADFPGIDFLIITHNHYDHLDTKTVRSLYPKLGAIYTSMGVGRYLSGLPDRITVTELDWWETFMLKEDISITATPARHFSGRGLKQNASLWSSFVLQIYGYKLFLGGDSGYGPHFKTIGEKYGPFDLALLECGQYNELWHPIHLFPEETVQAAFDIQAKVLMPVHWGKFALANHPWNEPIQQSYCESAGIRSAVDNSNDWRAGSYWHCLSCH